MRFRAIFIGGPLDGQERATTQSTSTVKCREQSYRDGIVEYKLLFGYGENTLVYSTLEASSALDLVFETYMEYMSGETIL